MTDEPKFVHVVYFTLKPGIKTADEMVAACEKYLTGHPGEVFFAAGKRAEAMTREVNDREFDVSLHIVFDSKANHDAYQVAERHDEFIAENKEAWAKVRVFDSLV